MRSDPFKIKNACDKHIFEFTYKNSASYDNAKLCLYIHCLNFPESKTFSFLKFNFFCLQYISCTAVDWRIVVCSIVE